MNCICLNCFHIVMGRLTKFDGLDVCSNCFDDLFYIKYGRYPEPDEKIFLDLEEESGAKD